MKILDQLTTDYPALESMRDPIMRAYTLLLECFRGGHKLLLCGNGGSCCDCQHIAGELMKGFLSLRPLTDKQKSELSAYGTEGGALAQKLQRALPTLVLSDLQGLSTAFANDVEPDMVYAQQAYALAVPGDVLMGVSTSGNAHNVYLAAVAAKAKGASVIGLTGQTGGRLAALCDVLLNVPETETYRVQEKHLPVYHALCAMLEQTMFGGREA